MSHCPEGRHICFHGVMPNAPYRLPAPAVRKRSAAFKPIAWNVARVRVFVAIAVVVASVAGSLAGCSSHRCAVGGTRTPRSADASSASSPTPSPTDTTVISTVSSIVPFVDAALKRQGFDLPLEKNEAECHAGRSSRVGTSGHIGQTCRWHSDEVGKTSYHILSVAIILWTDSGAAQQQVDTSATQEQSEPKPVAALGDAAMAGGAQAPAKPVKVRGRDQYLALTGADLAVRVHNVSIDLMWLGANFRISARGVPDHVTGVSRDLAIHQATLIAKAILANIH